MIGDMPCNVPCGNRWCRYNEDGHCADNCTCAALAADNEQEGQE